jgi:hypothetical protein
MQRLTLLACTFTSAKPSLAALSRFKRRTVWGHNGCIERFLSTLSIIDQSLKPDQFVLTSYCEDEDFQQETRVTRGSLWLFYCPPRKRYKIGSAGIGSCVWQNVVNRNQPKKPSVHQNKPLGFMYQELKRLDSFSEKGKKLAPCTSPFSNGHLFIRYRKERV